MREEMEKLRSLKVKRVKIAEGKGEIGEMSGNKSKNEIKKRRKKKSKEKGRKSERERK